MEETKIIICSNYKCSKKIKRKSFITDKNTCGEWSCNTEEEDALKVY